MSHVDLLDYRGRDLLEVLVGGVLGGVIAGLAMMAGAVVHAAATGMGWLLPLRQVAATSEGVGALIGGVSTVLIGLGIHLGVSAVWGLGFALFIRARTDLPLSILVGLAWGVAVWLVMTFGFLPYLNGVQYARVQLAPWAWLGLHLLFGFVLGLLPLIERRLVRAAAPEHAVVVRG